MCYDKGSSLVNIFPNQICKVNTTISPLYRFIVSCQQIERVLDEELLAVLTDQKRGCSRLDYTDMPFAKINDNHLKTLKVICDHGVKPKLTDMMDILIDLVQENYQVFVYLYDLFGEELLPLDYDFYEMKNKSICKAWKSLKRKF